MQNPLLFIEIGGLLFIEIGGYQGDNLSEHMQAQPSPTQRGARIRQHQLPRPRPDWWLPLPTTQSDRPRRLRLEAAYQVGAGSTRSRYRLTVQVKACLSWDADTPWNRPRGTACSESKACVDI